MGKRKVIIKQSVAHAISEVAWFIESKGMIATADKFVDSIYDFIEGLADDRKVHPLCRDPNRHSLGFKCRSFKKKYTVVFLETESELTICEFIPSKLIKW
jgi:hypothetical protein